jgi:hypothetical protein
MPRGEKKRLGTRRESICENCCENYCGTRIQTLEWKERIRMRQRLRVSSDARKAMRG